MKNFAILLILFSICFAAQGQFTYKIKADSVKITNDSCTAELILENHTKNINGFLYNRGNGRTEFRAVPVFGIDDVLAVRQPLSANRNITGVNLYNLRIDSANFIVRGVFGTGQPIPTYTESQMFFNPLRAAFRAGSSKWWNDDSSFVGWYSAAFGTRTKATNTSAFAIGTDASATGEHSFAGGWGGTASGWISFSHGLNTLASNQMTQAFGYNSIASGFAATSFGNANSSGAFSSGFGVGTKSKSYGGMVLGTYNDSTDAASPTAFNASNRIFQLGIGTADNARANAMTVLYNGNVGIGTVNPTALVHVGASTTSRASLRIDGGTAPTSPNNGDVWHANNHLYAQLNGSTTQLDGQWNTLGNAGTNSSTNFLGTTDNQSLVFRTNNVERMRIRFAGNGMDGFVGIGTSNPASLVHLYGQNPAILIEGDSNSYFPGIVLKSPVYAHVGVIDPYGIYASNTGGVRIWTPTPNGRGEVGATPAGVRTVSTDSTMVTHQIIAAHGQTAAIFDVAENISAFAGYSVPGSLFTVKSNGKLNLARYHNSVGEDSVLTTDASGNVKLRSLGSSISSNAWILTGNAGTSPSSNFLGTTDAQRLVFRTKNIERATIDTIGHVGIGTSSNALHTLQVGMLEGSVDGRATARFLSDDSWQTNVRIDNTTSNTSFDLVVGGSGNTSTSEGVVRGSFGIVRTKIDGSGTNIPLVIDSIGRVRIGTGLGGTNNLPRAALDVDNITTGVLIPRLTTTQRNAITGGDLRTSLLLYNTDVSTFQYYDGSAWRSLSNSGATPSNVWGLTGNAGTSPSTNFLGTTDAQRLVFRTKNIERATIDTFGRVGIGTNAPTDLLTVVKSETGVTADSKIINANAQGATFNTTSSVLTSYGGYFNSNATRASGSNNLTNIGLFATASGAQVNYALKTDGSVNMSNLSTTTDTTSYKPLAVNSSGDVAKVTGWPPAVNYSVQSLTDGSTITWNAANGINAVVTLAGTGRTLSITNPMAGMTYTIRIIQDGTGSRTITTWPTNSKWPSGTTPTLSTVANRYDIVVLYYDGTNYYGTYQQNFQ